MWNEPAPFLLSIHRANEDVEHSDVLQRRPQAQKICSLCGWAGEMYFMLNWSWSSEDVLCRFGCSRPPTLRIGRSRRALGLNDDAAVYCGGIRAKDVQNDPLLSNSHLVCAISDHNHPSYS
jgi:hypothetical protein